MVQYLQVIKERKTLLAKLLAKENIEVRHGKYPTAMFDPKARVLCVPEWDFSFEPFLDMLLAHEVSHAHHSTREAIDIFVEEFGQDKFAVWNIIEDIRIERLIQVMYPGLISVFRKAYEHVTNIDLMKVGDNPLDKRLFIDRLNIHAKIGPFVSVPLSDKERDFYDRCMLAETASDVLELCREAIPIVEEEQRKNQEEEEEAAESDENGSPSNEESSEESQEEAKTSGSQCAKPLEEDTTEEGEEEEGDAAPRHQSEEENTTDIDGTSSGECQGDDEIPLSKDVTDYSAPSDDMMSKSLEDSVDMSSGYVFHTPSDKTLLKYVVPYEEVKENRDSHRTEKHVTEGFKAFKREQTTHIAYLVSEFERKKAAHQYSHGTIARSGKIDVNALHRYKLDDDIFLSLNTLADAKSHGMLMFIDYSGSMSYILDDTIKQTLILSMFCQKVGIPFEVYGFTSYWGTNIRVRDALPQVGPDEIDFAQGSTCVFELLSSRLKKADLATAMSDLYLSTSLGAKSEYEDLGGTPLNYTIIISQAIIRRFQERNRVQKTSVIFLTDGDDTDKIQSKECRESWVRGGQSFVFNGKKFGGTGWMALQGALLTEKLFNSLRENNSITLIGYRLANTFTKYKDKMSHKVNKAANANKLAHMENIDGYDHFFLIKLEALIVRDHLFEDDDSDVIDVNDKKEVSNLRKTFKTGCSARKRSRVFLSEFSDVIA